MNRRDFLLGTAGVAASAVLVVAVAIAARGSTSTTGQPMLRLTPSPTSKLSSE